MIYKDHFSEKLDFHKYNYYCVPIESEEEYLELVQLLYDNSRKDKPTSQKDIDRFFNLLAFVRGKEWRHYEKKIQKYVDEIVTHFEQEPGYIFESYPAKLYYEEDEERIEIGFRFMVANAIREVLMKDRATKGKLSKTRLLEYIIHALLKYRYNTMPEKLLTQFTCYRTLAVAGCIAHKVFGKNYSAVKKINDSYFKSGLVSLERLQQKHPELFDPQFKVKVK